MFYRTLTSNSDVYADIYKEADHWSAFLAMEPSHYIEIPKNIRDKIVATRNGNKAE